MRHPHPRPQLAVAAGVFLAILILAAVSLLSGCRTAGPQICIRDSHDITVAVKGDLDTMQGKTVSPDTSLAASVAATLRDITAAQGDATRTGESGASENASDATAAITDPQGDPPVAPTDDPAAAPVRATGGSPSVPTTNPPAAAAAPQGE